MMTTDTANRLENSTPAVKAPPTVAELAQAHADYEVQRVKAVVAASFDGHPMAMSEPAWQYVAELLRDAYRVGVAKGEDLRMADINTRYTLTARR